MASLSLEQKVRLLTGADFWSLHPEPAVGLRRLVVSDGPAGVRGERWDERDPSANVPSPTALAATWDEELVEKLGGLLASEARRKGVDVVLAPTVNLHRTPYGGRHFECFSEDPLLTARIGVGYVCGLQDGGVGATVKHFVANDSETERMTLDARLDERTLRELYLAPFEAIVREAGVWSVMASYNAVNGEPMTESSLLYDILHRELGFDGVVMSDWFATRATEASASAALDLVMPGPAGPWGEALLAAVHAGEVDAAAIDDKVLRILRLAARVGALDGTAPAPTAHIRRRRDRVGAPPGRGSGVRAGAQRGRGLLPLDREPVADDRGDRPERRRGQDARRRERDRVPALHGVAARRPEGRARARRRHTPQRRRAVERPDTSGGSAMAARARRQRARRRGSLPGRRRKRVGERPPPRVHVQVARLVRYADRRADRGPHRAARDRRPARTPSARPGSAATGCRSATTVAFDERLELRPGADIVEGLMVPPQATHELELGAGRGDRDRARARRRTARATSRARSA